MTRLRLPVLPYLFACTFIADTASFLLPVSNPLNILVTSQFPLNLLTFVRLLFLPSLLVIGINAGVFYFLYRRQLHGHFDIKRLPALQETVKHQAYFRYTCVIVILVAAAYVIAAAIQFPLSLVALSGALVLLFGALFWKQTTLLGTARQISWPIFGFIAGMFLVIQALETTGLTAQFGQLLLRLSGGTSFGAVMVGTLGSALGTNLINNVPMAVVMTSSLRGIQHAPVALQQGLLAATIFGCDLGPTRGCSSSRIDRCCGCVTSWHRAAVSCPEATSRIWHR